MNTISSNSLPDLPELESVQTRDFSMLLVVLGYSSFHLVPFPFMVWMYVTLRAFIPLPAVAIMAIFSGFILWMVLRILSGFMSYKIDANGLSLRGPFRSAYIPWIDVKEALLKKTLTGSPLLILRTADRVLKIVPESIGGAYSGHCMIASAWQHLRRLGRSDSIELPDRSLSLWREIGDDIPREIEWGKRPRTAMKIGCIVGISFCPAMIIAGCIGLDLNVMLLPMSLMCAVLIRLLVPQALRTASRVHLTEDYLEAYLPFAKVSLFWSQVTSAFWMGHALVIRSENPRAEIRIPYPGRRGVEQLILAVIRRLRTAGVPQAVIIPELISPDRSLFNKPVLSDQRLAILKRAFIESLDEPARSHIRRLYYFAQCACMVGIFAGGGLAFADLPARVSRLIHTGPSSHVLYFFCANAMVVGVPLILGSIVFFGLLGEYIAQRCAGPHKQIWQEFSRIGNTKLNRAIMYICIVLGAAAVLSMPLIADCYVRVTDSGIGVNRFFALKETFYPWSEIRAFECHKETYVNSGRVHSRETYTVRFADGSDWSFGPGDLWSWTRKDFDGAVAHIPKKTGRAVEYK